MGSDQSFGPRPASRSCNLAYHADLNTVLALCKKPVASSKGRLIMVSLDLKKAYSIVYH